MEIYLLRHGIAAERGSHTGPDEERALTAEGVRKVRRVAQAMRVMRLSFDSVFSSPLVRALETAELVAKSLRLKKRLRVTEHLVPGTPTGTQIAWLRSLRPAPGSVLLVGHEPNFSELASRLLTGQERLAIEFKKAGLCKITAEPPGSGHGTLEWLLTPRQMELMR
ncbi:MAG: phosphohistidine phosphatase SixA [Verrucomicrobia subdivision 3 bacterium]|nr:phosphohistidine phosphatase SixA [Limisphaerales bacterium]